MQSHPDDQLPMRCYFIMEAPRSCQAYLSENSLTLCITRGSSPSSNTPVPVSSLPWVLGCGQYPGKALPVAARMALRVNLHYLLRWARSRETLCDRGVCSNTLNDRVGPGSPGPVFQHNYNLGQKVILPTFTSSINLMENDREGATPRNSEQSVAE